MVLNTDLPTQRVVNCTVIMVPQRYPILRYRLLPTLSQQPLCCIVISHRPNPVREEPSVSRRISVRPCTIISHRPPPVRPKPSVSRPHLWTLVEATMSSNPKNDGLVGLENNGLVGLENNGLDREGLAMVVDDNCEFIFEGRSYRSYTDYVQARQSWTAGIFANSGIIASGPILSIPIYLKTCLYGPSKFSLK